MEWLNNENGILFHDLGIVYGPAEYKNSDQISLSTKDKSITIEIWLTPGSDGYNRFSYIFGLYDDHYQEIFSLAQAKSLLNISKYKKPGKRGLTYNWRWLKNAFFKGQKRFLTITSDKTGTTVYLDGKRAHKFRNYSLMPTGELTPPGRVVIGIDPSGKKPWTGTIHGLAFYNQALPSKQIVEHFDKWKGNSALSLLNEKDIIALYPMDEKNGQIIHNAVLNNFHLSIPNRFKILKKKFLELSDNALRLNGSNLRDMRINILGFIPLGYLLLVTFYSTKSSWTSSWRLIFWAVLGGTVLSFVIETLQAYLPTRNSSLTDLIFNSFGTGIGTILAILFIMIKTRSQKTSFSESQ